MPLLTRFLSFLAYGTKVAFEVLGKSCIIGPNVRHRAPLVSGQSPVSNQPVGPEVHHLDLQLVSLFLYNLRDVHAPWRRPDGTQVLSIQNDLGHVLDQTKIEVLGFLRP